MKTEILIVSLMFLFLLAPQYADTADEKMNIGTLPRAEDKSFYYSEYEVSAYTLREEECDSDPFIGASLTDLRFEKNTFASNQLPLGAWIEYDGKFFQNQDRMNKRYNGNYLDLCFKFDLKGAREFGRKYNQLIKVYK